MTEEEWVESTDPKPLILYLEEQVRTRKAKKAAARKVYVRKARLFCCAGARLLWEVLREEPDRRCVEVAERFADGLTTESERASAEEDHRSAGSRDGRLEWAAGEAAFWTVWSDPEHLSGAIHFYSQAAQALAYGAVNHRRGNAWRDANRAALRRLTDLYRDVFGNPFHPIAFSPKWRTDTAVSLAAQMYESRDFGPMPILADALQDAGCDNADVLNHCRAPGEHVRGCWVVDLLLGKE